MTTTTAPIARAEAAPADPVKADMLSALKSALDHLLTEAEKRDYDPPVPTLLVADLEHAIARAEGRA